MRRNGTTFAISNPDVVSKDEAATHVDGAWRPIFARLPFEQAVLFARTP